MDYDVVILGGALSGSSAAYLILKERPSTRVLILERESSFSRRVGESTVEASSYFLGKVLGLSDYLNEHHLIKQGLRFWYGSSDTHCIDDATEIGSGYHVRLPGYQIDRSTLDEEVLARVSRMGAEVVRGVTVRDVDISKSNEVTVAYGNATSELSVKARWIIDASGQRTFLAHKLNSRKALESHPTTSIWARWKGCRSLDDPSISTRPQSWKRRCHGTRMTATNHFIGKGWWAWCILLKGGDVSVGVVYDERFIDPMPSGLSREAKLRHFLDSHPVAREVIRDATVCEGDLHQRKQLPYVCDALFGKNYAMVGDAAGFIDPFYSPGLDWVAFTAHAASMLVIKQLSGECREALPQQYSDRFSTAYQRWYEAVYKDKYAYMGDAGLMWLGFRLDLALYYIGVVRPVFLLGNGFDKPPFTRTGACLPFWFMKGYNARLAAIGKKRMYEGKWGRANHGRVYVFNSYTLDWKLYVRLLGMLPKLLWLFLLGSIR